MTQHLSSAQNAVVNSIVNYGNAHGFDSTDMQCVRDIAFAESSLGTLTNSTHVGLFQYDPATWNSLYPSLDIGSQNDQIQAMFSEAQTYGAQFIAAVQAGNTLYANYTASEYVDAVHHFHLGQVPPHVTKANLDSAKAEITAAVKALGTLILSPHVNDNGEQRGTGIAGYAFDLQFGWVNYSPDDGPVPQVTVGPSTVTDSFGQTWNIP